MRDITLGQIGTAILKGCRLTYPIWRVCLGFFSFASLMAISLLGSKADVIREGKHIEGMWQIQMTNWAFGLMFICFAYLLAYWFVREAKDWENRLGD